MTKDGFNWDGWYSCRHSSLCCLYDFRCCSFLTGSSVRFQESSFLLGTFSGIQVIQFFLYCSGGCEVIHFFAWFFGWISSNWIILPGSSGRIQMIEFFVWFCGWISSNPFLFAWFFGWISIDQVRIAANVAFTFHNFQFFCKIWISIKVSSCCYNIVWYILYWVFTTDDFTRKSSDNKFPLCYNKFFCHTRRFCEMGVKW